jgi:hypothetical protein
MLPMIRSRALAAVFLAMLSIAPVAAQESGVSYVGAAAALRDTLLSLQPGDIDVSSDVYAQTVWAVVMEQAVPNGAYFVFGVVDGTSSIYFSSGGGFIGGSEVESIRTAALAFVDEGEKYLAYAKPTASFPTPGPGEVIFYFLTFDGSFIYRARRDELVDMQDPLAGFYRQGHRVVSAFRNEFGGEEWQD